ncbi:hypothetical protein HK097_001985 [Rhizophlyctis rosea]|uniref:Major facilitator superfamily (MFS) profile domain-containing protein n=1 Tax=Rhizophlyctis rosea TaxID=64517 RepID=A0AAD5SHD0_9FUNG|nr:hypothetical protein HK097_001985 [Rhizophlyctis rosea]
MLTESETSPSKSDLEAQTSNTTLVTKVEDIPTTEITDPKKWPRHRKYGVLILVALAGTMSPINTTILYPALNDMAKDLNTSVDVINSTVAIFMACLAFFPLAWGTASEILGRRPIYLLSLTIYVGASLAASFSPSIGILIFLRAVQALGSSSVLAVGAGTIADIFDQSERGRAMGTFYLGPLLAPVVGPVLGGVIAEKWKGWNSIFWFVAILGGVNLGAMAVFLPETLDKRRAKARTDKSWNPLRPLLYFRYKVALLPTVTYAIAFATMYLINSSLPITYTNLYAFTTSQTGYAYLGLGVGTVLGSLGGGFVADKLSARYKGKKEARLISGMVGTLIYPVGVLVYGLAIEEEWWWGVGILAHGVVGFGLMILSNSVATYLLDSFTSRSATVIAAQNCVRYLLAAASSMAVLPILSVTRHIILFGCAAGVCVCTIGLIIALYQRGEKWRKEVERDGLS